MTSVLVVGLDSMDPCVLERGIDGSKTVATKDAVSQEDCKCLKEMEAGVGIEPASTALQFPPPNKSQQWAAGDSNNIRGLQRRQQSAIMLCVVATVPNLSQV